MFANNLRIIEILKYFTQRHRPGKDEQHETGQVEHMWWLQPQDILQIETIQLGYQHLRFRQKIKCLMMMLMIRNDKHLQLSV